MLRHNQIAPKLAKCQSVPQPLSHFSGRNIIALAYSNNNNIMEAACEAARAGRIEYFQEQLDSEKLAQLAQRADEDNRTLLHNAAAGKNAMLFKLVLGHTPSCNTSDDEVNHLQRCHPS